MGKSLLFGCTLAAIVSASACAEDEHGRPADDAPVTTVQAADAETVLGKAA